VTIDRVVASPGRGDAHVLEVKVKEAKDEVEPEGADPSVAKAYAMEVMQVSAQFCAILRNSRNSLTIIVSRCRRSRRY
jgi:translation elongation factor P/translation initiation factor 5A